jgi:hypothetical protein
MSTTDIAKPNSEMVKSWVDQFERHAQEEPSASWAGKLLKFAKGEFFAVDEDGGEDEVEIGTKLVVAIDTLTIGWEKWVDKHLVDQRVGLIIDGFSRPERDELDDVAKESWRKDKEGKPTDPWQPVSRVSMYTKRGDADSIYTFITRSDGGIKAINKLRDRAMRELRMRPDVYPVVELGVRAYEHEEWGRIKVPTLKVVGWEEMWTGATLKTAPATPATNGSAAEA